MLRLGALPAAVVVLACAAPAQAGLTFASCIRDNDSVLPGCATAAPGLGGAVGLALSPDGHQLYEAAFDDFAVGTFALDAAGTPSFTRCVQGTSSRGGGPPECTGSPVAGLQYSQQILLSPDGRFAYVGGPVLNVFTRDATTGALSYAGCAGQSGSGCATTDDALAGGAIHLALSPDGTNLYVTTTTGLAVLDRDPTSGALAAAASFSGLAGPLGVAVTPDGAGVYVAQRDSNAVAIYTRAPTGDHPLTAAGCIDETGGTCAAHSAGLRRPSAVFVAPDGKTVTATTDQGTVAVFTRDATTQALAFSGCIKGSAGDEACAESAGVGSAGEFYVTPDGRNVYTGGRDVNALTVYARDPKTGFLSFVECIKDVTVAAGAFESACTKTAPAMQSAGEMLASPDGKLLYIAVQGVFTNIGALDTFTRTADTAAIAAPALPTAVKVSKTGVVSLPLRCPTGVTEFCTAALGVAGPGLAARSAAKGPKAVRRHIARRTRHGRVTVKVRLSRRLRQATRLRVVVARRNANGTTTTVRRRVRVRAAAT